MRDIQSIILPYFDTSFLQTKDENAGINTQADFPPAFVHLSDNELIWLTEGPQAVNVNTDIVINIRITLT